MPSSHDYGRSGWNKRGPTIASQLQNAKEISDPNSYHWQNKANNAKLALEEVMGGDQFEAWIERLWPGDTIDSVTWKEICEMFVVKLERELAGGISRNPSNDPKHCKTNGYY